MFYVALVVRTCCKRMMLMALSFVATEGVLGGFVRCKIDSMGGTCTLSVPSTPDFSPSVAYLHPSPHSKAPSTMTKSPLLAI